MSAVPGTGFNPAMQVVALKTLKAFWDRYPEAETPLRDWYNLVSKATWTHPAEIRQFANSADFVGDNRVIFNIGGNKFRLVIHVSYVYKSVLIKFVGTHAEYDRIDPETT